MSKKSSDIIGLVTQRINQLRHRVPPERSIQNYVQYKYTNFACKVKGKGHPITDQQEPRGEVEV
jgi:hypothetical protein